MLWLQLLFALLLCACTTRASLVDDIVDAIENAVSCSACHALLVPLAGVAELGDSAFSDTIIEVCKILGVSCPACRNSFVPHVVPSSIRLKTMMFVKGSLGSRVLWLPMICVPSTLLAKPRPSCAMRSWVFASNRTLMTTLYLSPRPRLPIRKFGFPRAGHLSRSPTSATFTSIAHIQCVLLPCLLRLKINLNSLERT